MAKKVYEEKNIRAIAERIRSKTGTGKVYKVSDMPTGIDEVFAAGGKSDKLLGSLIDRSVTAIIIPDGVTSIGGYTFCGCTSLASITIPDSVTSIGSSAFDNCTSLASVTIGNSVTSIGSRAFWGCRSLASIAIPDSVTSISGYAFYSCSNLTSIEIPNSITSIGDSVFYDCSSLASITIPDSVTSIGGAAFLRCISLTSITIPDSVTSIGSNAFYNCTSLTSVTIGNSVTSIKYSAFSGCPAEFDFSRCTSVPSLESTNCFTKGDGLKIIVPSSLYDEWISATNWTAYKEYIIIAPSTGLLYEYDGTYSVIGRGSCTDSTIVIPETYDDGVHGELPVTDIYEGFENDQTLEEIILPENAENRFYIGGYPFEGSSLKKVKNFFRGSSFIFSGLALEYVSILDGADIGNGCIAAMNGSPVYDFSRHTSVAQLSADYYITVGPNTRIIVPAALLDEWKQATNWAVHAQYIVAAE